MQPSRASLACVLAAALLLAGCAGEAPRADLDYVVQDNDTLYSIAWRNDVDYRELARWNGIGADYRIAVGQRLRLTPPAIAPDQGAESARAAPTVPAPAPAPVQWVWPTERHGAPVPARNGGMLFAGNAGQPVRAAARGRVVYVGSGIRGYGQLIIIKHSETLLSAYAYNDAVMVREGQEIAAGTQVATMGKGPHSSAALYFEIRVNGRPVPVLPLLPHVK